MLKGFLMKMQNFFMHCRFQQWRPQFDDWYIFCFRIESFPNNSKNIISCLYIHISLRCSLTCYNNVLSVALCHFLSLLSKVWCHRTDNYAYFCVINGNPASVGGYNQVVQDWLHVMVPMRFSFHKPITGYSIWWDFPHIYSFLEFFWRCKISYNSHKFQIKISWINIP